MGFNLYFAGFGTTLSHIQVGPNCGKLFTFADGVKAVNKQISVCNCDKVFIDSGAYSIARRGAVLNIDDYVSFINSTDFPLVFASLDAIPFPELNAKTAIECSKKSWENYLYIVHRVKDQTKPKILPVYHFGEPLEYLELILNTEIDGKLIDYMGLGGGNAGEFSRNLNYYTKIFDTIKKSKNPNIKVHAFGMTVPKLLEMFPFYSADSTTWLKHAVNGMIFLENGKAIGISTLSKGRGGSFWSLPAHTQQPIIHQIEEKGFTLKEVSEDYKKRQEYNLIYFKDWADNYQYKGYDNPRKRLF